MSAQTSDKMLADALDVAEKLSDELKKDQDLIIAVVKQTAELAEFSKGKLDHALILIAGGNPLKAALILADLRIRFDNLVKANERLVKPTEKGNE